MLIVEDEEDIRFLLSFWLTEDPRCEHVWEADSPATATLESTRHALDVILLDFKLSGGTAADCLPQLRADHPHARIIVYTANRAVAEQAGVIALGADRILEKVSVVVEDVVEFALGDNEPPSGRSNRAG